MIQPSPMTSDSPRARKLIEYSWSLLYIALFAIFAAGTLFASPQPARKPVAVSFDATVRSAETARDAGEMDKAAKLYRQAVRLRPEWEEGWWNLGSIAYDGDKWPECVVAFQKLTAIKSDSAPGLTMEGLCQYRLRDFPASLASFERVEMLKYNLPPELARAARLHYGLVLTRTESFEKALVVLTELVRIDKKSEEIAVAAGIAGLRKAWLPSEVAEGDRDKVFKLGDAMATAMEMDYKNAIEKFEIAIRDYPRESNAHFRFGAYLMLQNPDRGVEEIRKAVELEPAHVPALVSLTMIFLRRDEPATAKTYAAKAVEVSPNDFASHVALGRTLLALGEGEGAVVELERSVKLAPASPDARYNLASAYARVGRKADAAVQQEEFKRLKKLTEAPTQ